MERLSSGSQEPCFGSRRTKQSNETTSGFGKFVRVSGPGRIGSDQYATQLHPRSLYEGTFTNLTTSLKIKDMKRAIVSVSQIHRRTSLTAYVENCNSVLKTCSTQGWIQEGRSIHGHLIKMGISSNKYVAIKLLNMYLNCKRTVDVNEILAEFGGFNLVAWNCIISAKFREGDVDEACHLFDEMPEKNEVSLSSLIAGLMRYGRVDESISYFENNPFQDVVSWTAMINGFVQNGFDFEALKVFRKMRECGIMPNAITFTCVIKACIGLREFVYGRSLLSLIVRYGFDHNVSVCNSLITLSLRMGEIKLARRIFDEMEERDVVSWTSFLDVCVEMGELTEARQIFEKMRERNEVSWSTMIARYSQSGDAKSKEALKLYNQMVLDGLKPNLSCLSSIISASATLLDLRLGKNIHGHMIKMGMEAEVFVGSPLIDMYCKCGKTEDGRRVFDSILERNVVSWNSMMSGYSLNGQLQEAEELFERLPKRNSVSWNTMISGYLQNKHYDKVLVVFSKMLSSGETPNGFTFSSILSACASLASLGKGKNIHGKILKLGIQYEVFLGTALTDMYAKSGDIESSRKVFNRMTEKNEVTWTAMLQALAENGFADESLNLFEEMKRTSAVAPTELMFLAVLFACSHCGLVDKAFKHFESMERVYNLKPKNRHYTCMVDLLARSGRLREAEELINDIPFQPEANAWASLLSACSTYKNEEIAERTVTKLWELANENAAGYVLLSNIYASAGRWSDVMKVRKLMKEKKLKKTGGCSWVEVRNQVHYFYCEDGNHSQSSEVYGILELLMCEMVTV
ncbi:Pentatricopeptide repeat-containing protein [Thalictrum thalictroides]|uniref:Pentatricopeptide repeat-containing protein n=1 Tax=Thalictrum thalictroides TaxID=46969 RepID=A0A7J6X8B1_THATH|nr:Pentatricopeptide repeat-containing protein [Thalictrum thalictroides]